MRDVLTYRCLWAGVARCAFLYRRPLPRHRGRLMLDDNDLTHRAAGLLEGRAW